jgi:predicted O-linked N-acetylglucosamine transferase (SPINDLY family)
MDIMGIDDTVASNESDYTAIVVRLVNDTQFRAGVEAQMETNTANIWNREVS